jgi:glucose/mannose-6-phosphate isomerase
VSSNDRSNQLDDVLALPDHLSDALWRVESARIEPFDAPGGLVVCGMGGSAIGGDLAAVAFGNRLSRPLTTERGYELPFAMLPDRAVLCSSYSGDTEETIACY